MHTTWPFSKEHFTEPECHAWSDISSPAGGFKLWECALDLAQHLCSAFDIRAMQAQWTCTLPCCTRVLELGCGHGLPGILMMLAGCEAHFQVGSASFASESTLSSRCWQTGTDGV